MDIIATLTIKKPGAMGEKQRMKIVAWLRKQALNLLLDGAKYNDTGDFTARYFSPEK